MTDTPKEQKSFLAIIERYASTKNTELEIRLYLDPRLKKPKNLERGLRLAKFEIAIRDLIKHFIENAQAIEISQTINIIKEAGSKKSTKKKDDADDDQLSLINVKTYKDGKKQSESFSSKRNISSMFVN